MDNLKDKAINGAKWTTFSTAITTVLQFVQLIILARLLTPDVFGLMAIVMIVNSFALAFSDMGVSSAIIHRQNITNLQLSSLYWINIMAGIFVYLIIIVSIPGIVWVFNEPQLNDLMPLMALAFLLIPWGQQYQVLLQKELAFKTIALIESFKFSFGFVITIILAINGYGVYSLIFGQLSSMTVSTLCLIYIGMKSWKPSFYFKTKELKGFLSFGFYQMAERTLNIFSQRLDQLLIGALAGVHQLGLYTLAYNLIMQPIFKINPIITNIAFPMFAKMQNDNARLKRGYFSVLKILSFINAPLIIGVAVTAPILIPTVFGEKWADAVILVQILSFVALFRSTGNPIGSLLLAKGRADLGFKWNLGILIAQVPSIYLGFSIGGVTGIASAILIMQVILFFLNYYILVKTLIGKCFMGYMMTMLPSFILSLIMGLSVYLISLLITNHISDGFIALTLEIFSGAIVYILLQLVFQKSFVFEIKQLLLKK